MRIALPATEHQSGYNNRETTSKLVDFLFPSSFHNGLPYRTSGTVTAAAPGRCCSRPGRLCSAQSADDSVNLQPYGRFHTKTQAARLLTNRQVYPNNAPIIAQGGSAVPPGLFDPNATGRITPLGNFTGFEDSIEYFFGLAPMPQTNAAGLGLYEADVVAFASGCPEVAASVVYLKGGPVNNVTGGLIPGSPTTTLKQVGSPSSRGYENF